MDLGHNKEVFPEADVFPCILVARKPDASAPPETARVCVLPREQTRVDDLSEQIATEGVAVPRSRFGAEPWNLEPPGVTKLMEKLGAVGVPLKEFIGASPLYGIKTGFNDAFLLDTATKDKLVAADPKCEPLFKPYLRGQDIDRWRAEWCGLWMLTMKSSTNHDWPWADSLTEVDAEAALRAAYPSLHAHFTTYQTELKARGNQGRYWWELGGGSNWAQYDRPKIMYQEIQFHPCYMIDNTGMLANNKVYLLPCGDLYLLGVLNSPLMWWHNWRHLPHMKDEALTPAGYRMEEVPIPKPTDEQRAAVETAVGRLIEITGAQQEWRAAVLDWLRSEFAVEKPTQKLQALAGLGADEFAAEVKKAGKKGLGVADLKRLKDEHAKSVLPLHKLAREAEQLERRVSDVVNAAFGLTPDDVKLMWDTAPPRMPIARPAGQ